MAQGTQELTRDIELTLQRLSDDVDELSNKVSPREIAHRRKQAARSRIGGLRDKVMGSREHVVGATHQAAHQATPDLAQETGPALVQAAERRFEGNPLAAGVIAFGAGMFLSALIPPTQAEQRLAEQGTEAAKEHGGSVADQARGVAQQVGQELQQSVGEAAQQVKGSAQEHARTLTGEARDAAGNVEAARQRGKA